jgi:arylsulfatase A-like enzyme
MNLIYINTHDSGKIISPYGWNVPTDNLMDFAKDSMLFSNAFCCGPTCSPSRAAMLTGTYPHQNGMLGLAQRGFDLNDKSKHLANFLKNNGYHTCISGIQHELGWYLDLDVEADKSLGYQDVLTQDAKAYNREDLHLWDAENSKSVSEWLDKYDDGKPFMLSYGMHSTHRPYPVEIDEVVNENYIKPINHIHNNKENRHDFAEFMTSLKHADENVKVIIEALKRNNFYENSIIIFTTDHGVALPFNKCNLSDNGMAVSLIMKVPSQQKGDLYEGIISNIDIFPTICDLMNIEKPEYLEGKSFAKVFNDTSIEVNQELFAEVNFHTSYEPMRCIRTNRYKYIKYFDDFEKINLSNIDTSIPKDFLMENGLKDLSKPRELLYDLFMDPSEGNNLSESVKYSNIKIQLEKKLNEHMVNTNDPLIDGQITIKPNYKVNKKECVDASSTAKDDYISLGK